MFGMESSSRSNEQKPKKGGAFRWLRRASTGELPPPLMRASIPSDVASDNREVKNCDPLIYRLRHQKEVSTRRKRLGGNLCRRRSDAGDYRVGERDPFDLWGSITSEEISQKISPDENDDGDCDDNDDGDESSSSHVDVKGWESSLNRKTYNLSDEDEEDTSELLVGFGGVTPSPRKSQRGQCSFTSDADHFPLHAPEQNIRQLSQAYQSRHAHGSSVENVSPNTSYCGGSGDSFSPSLEQGSLLLPQTNYVVVECRSLATSPSAPCREYISEPSMHFPENHPHNPSTTLKHSFKPPLYSSTQCDQMSIEGHLRSQTPPLIWQSLPSPTPSQKTNQQQEEEEDPWSNQLKQRSAEELRVELINMQHQAKCNLEKTWAVTERLRVENSHLDDQVADIRQNLARVTMLSVGYVRQTSDQVNERRKAQSNCSLNSGGYLVKTKLCLSSWKMQPQSNYLRRHSLSAHNVLSGNASDDDEDHDGERSCGSRSSGRRRGSLSEFDRNVKSCSSGDSGEVPIRIRAGSFVDQIQTRYKPGSTGTIEIDEQLFNSLLGQAGEIDPSCYSFDDSSCDVLKDRSNTVSGVYYPASGIHSLSRNSLAGSSIGDDSFSSPTTEKVERIALDDFDFDPLHTLAETGPYKKEKPKDRRGSFIRNLSFMNLFEEKNNDVVDNSITSSLHQKVEENATMTNKLIRERENEIERATKSVQTQEEEILSYERFIAEAYDKCDESEMQMQEKQSKVQKEVDALQLMDSEIESKLNQLEASQQRAREQERALKHQIVMLDQMCQENGREMDLEAHLSWCQHQHETSQDIAIETLSSILDDVDGMRIPSLRGEDESNVSGDIIARFDDLTDKEEELVKVIHKVCYF